MPPGRIDLERRQKRMRIIAVAIVAFMVLLTIGVLLPQANSAPSPPNPRFDFSNLTAASTADMLRSVASRLPDPDRGRASHSNGPTPQAVATNGILGDTSFEQGSPNPYWLQGSDFGSNLIKTNAPRTGTFAADLCRGVNNCTEGVLQVFSAPLNTTGASLSVYFSASTDEAGGCYDTLSFFLLDEAGAFSPPIGFCADFSTGYSQLSTGVTAFIQSHAGQELAAVALAETDESAVSSFYVDDFTISATVDPATPPGTPTQVGVVAQDGAAYVTWSSPVDRGSSLINGYTVTASPGGVTATTTGHMGATVTGLSNGTPYTFTVTASNANGSGPGAIAGPATPTASAAAGPYQPLTPARILDTRPGEPTPDGIEGAVGPGTEIEVQVTGKGGVPPVSDVAAAVINVTVTNPTAASYLTIYPTGVSRPLASNLNFIPGQTVPNLVEVATGTGGRVTIFNAAGSVHVIADVQGYVKTAVTNNAGVFKPLTPARILDTRPSSFLTPASSLDLQVTGAGLVPTSSVAAVILNVTVTEPTAASFLTVYPTGQSRPLASNLNFTPGQTVPNRVIVPVGTNGKVTIYNAAGFVHVIVDVGAWFTDATASASTGGLFKGLTPARIADTRFESGAPYPGQTLLSGTTLLVQVAGQGGVPAITSPTPPKGVVLNVTISDGALASFLTVFPSDAARPLASDLNWSPFQTIPNLVVVKLGTDGKIKLFSQNGYIEVIVDVVGWYS